jgi:hypothetical protein
MNVPSHDSLLAIGHADVHERAIDRLFDSRADVATIPFRIALPDNPEFAAGNVTRC